MKKPDKSKKKKSTSAAKNPYHKNGSYGRSQPNASLKKRRPKKLMSKK